MELVTLLGIWMSKYARHPEIYLMIIRPITFSTRSNSFWAELGNSAMFMPSSEQEFSLYFTRIV